MGLGTDKLKLNYGLLLSLPFSEYAGVNVNDVAKPHHSVVVYGPTWYQLPSGLAVLSFVRASNQYLACPAAQSLDLCFSGSTAFSGSCWAYRSSDNWGSLFGKGILNVDGWEFSWADNERLYFTTYSPSTYATSSSYTQPLLTINTWHLVGFSHLTTGWVDFFVDGYQYTDLNESYSNTFDSNVARDLRIGWSGGGIGAWPGYIGRVCIWNRVLQPLEHMEIFNRERGLFGV